MKKLQKTISLSLSGVLFLAAIAALSPKNNGSSILLAQDCAHNHVEHHDAVASSIYNIGQVEYWCCCDCHQSFFDSNCTQLIDDTQYGLKNPNDGRYIAPIGTALDTKTVKNGTVSTVIPEGTAFDYVYTSHVAGQFVLENIDISSYQEVAFQIKSGVWHIYRDSWSYTGDPNVWVTYKLVQTASGVWSIYQRKSGSDFSCKFSGAEGTKLQDVFMLDGDVSDYYVTNLRYVELSQEEEEDIQSQYGELITDSAICSNNATYTKTSLQAPNGFKNVYKTSASGDRNDAYYYAQVNVDNFNKLAFSLRLDGTMLLDGYDYVDESHEWILVEVTPLGNYTYKVDFTSSTGASIYTNTFTYTDQHPNCTIGALNHVLWKACIYPKVQTDSLYVTELRGFRRSTIGDVIDSSALSSNGVPIEKADKNTFVPVGFDTVYSTSCSIGDKSFDKFFSSKKLTDYNQINLAINAHGWFLFDGWSQYIDADEWVDVTITNKGNNLFDVQFETRFKNIEGLGSKVFKKENINSAATVDDVDGFAPYSLNTLLFNFGVAFQNGKTISVTEIRGTTNIDLVSNSSTDYTVVIEKNNRYVNRAKDLFVSNLNESTGATISYRETNGEALNKYTKNISIGDTSLLQSSGLLDSIDLAGGYIIATVQNSIFVYAEEWGDYIIAINDLMNILFGYKFYYQDLVTMNHDTSISLTTIKKIVHPSFADRGRITEMSVLDPDVAASIGFKHNYEWETSSQSHTMCEHFLNINTYKASHPNWYSEGNDKWGQQQYQLCYSAHGSSSEYQVMVNTVCSEIIADINESTNAWVFDNSNNPTFNIDLSMQDNWYECNCASCQAEKATYGSFAGQQLHFVNDIANQMDAWLAANKPSLKCVYKLLAYQQAMQAPSSINYTLNKNIDLQFSTGCSDVDFSKPFAATGPTCNVTVYNQLVEWVNLFNSCQNVSSKNISIWFYSYSTNNMMPFFDYDAFAISFKNFSNLGIRKIHNEFITNGTPVPCFQDLSFYLKAKAMENTNIDLDEAAREFIYEYYGSGGPKIYEYFQALLGNMRNKYTDDVVEDMWAYHNNKKYWSKDTVSNLMTLCEEAIEAVESNETNEARKTLLIDRINREKCTPVYMFINYSYTSLLNKKTYKTFLSDNCAKFGITHVDNKTTVAEFISKH